MDKVLNMIGLAKKAGKLQAGAFLTENAIKNGKSRLVILAQDAPEKVKRQFENLCRVYEVACMEYPDKEQLSNSIGKENTAVISINDANFVKGLEKALEKKE